MAAEVGPCEEHSAPRYLGLSRSHADRLIQQLDEFGMAYFELSQIVRIVSGLPECRTYDRGPGYKGDYGTPPWGGYAIVKANAGSEVPDLLIY